MRSSLVLPSGVDIFVRNVASGAALLLVALAISRASCSVSVFTIWAACPELSDSNESGRASLPDRINAVVSEILAD